MMKSASRLLLAASLFAVAGTTAFAQSMLKAQLPSAGYEDEVLTNIDAYKNPFPDTNIGTELGTAAAELYRRGIIGGFPDGEFKGARPVNRAEAAKFLLLARFGIVDDVSNSGRFPDVREGAWYTKFIVTAAQKGIISGYPDGLFHPADQVNTAEFLKMLSLTFGLELNLYSAYIDVPADVWYAPYAGIAQKYDLFPDRGGELHPEAPLSRADVALAIYQYFKHRGDSSDDSLPTDPAGRRDTQRRSDVNTILNSIFQYAIDNNGSFPFSSSTVERDICQSQQRCSGVSLDALEGRYLVTVPVDPSVADGGAITGYKISVSGLRVTISAPHAENASQIQLTR